MNIFEGLNESKQIAMSLVIELYEQENSPFKGLINLPSETAESHLSLELRVKPSTDFALKKTSQFVEYFSANTMANSLVCLVDTKKGALPHFHVTSIENQVKVLINYSKVFETCINFKWSKVVSMARNDLVPKAYFNAAMDILREDLLLHCFVARDFSEHKMASLLSNGRWPLAANAAKHVDKSSATHSLSMIYTANYTVTMRKYKELFKTMVLPQPEGSQEKYLKF